MRPSSLVSRWETNLRTNGFHLAVFKFCSLAVLFKALVDLLEGTLFAFDSG